jgi:hypothetical protein
MASSLLGTLKPDAPLLGPPERLCGVCVGVWVRFGGKWMGGWVCGMAMK